MLRPSPPTRALRLTGSGRPHRPAAAAAAAGCDVTDDDRDVT